MMERIGAEMPELIADPDAAEANRASNEANLMLVAELIERGADPTRTQLPVPTIAYAEVGAHQNTPLTGLVRAYRIGHGFAWDLILEALREQVTDPDDFADAVGLISGWLHAYVDVAVCLAEDAYIVERERWLRSTSALRAQTIASILDGDRIDSSTVSARLGYELGREHLGLVAWLEEPDSTPDPLGALEDAISAVAELGGPTRPLVHPVGLASLAAWVGSRDALDGDAMVAAALNLDLGPVRVAVGGPANGVEGFVRAHAEAMHARRVAMMIPRTGDVTAYSNVALAALATTDLEHSRAFVIHNLGPLAEPGETNARLAETTRAYLDAGGSHGRAANRLGIHENTVRYRVRQVEDLLDRPIGPGDLDLRVALALAVVITRC
jgi:hypothetical protein